MVAKGSHHSAATKELCRVKALARWQRTPDRTRVKPPSRGRSKPVVVLAPPVYSAPPLTPLEVEALYTATKAKVARFAALTALAEDMVRFALDDLDNAEDELERVGAKSMQAQADLYAVKLRYFGTRAA